MKENVIELAVGQVAIINGVRAIVVEDDDRVDNCVDCVLHPNAFCGNLLCFASVRTDKKSVHFKRTIIK